ATTSTVRAKNASYHAAFPEDRERIEAVAAHLRSNDVRLPDASVLTVPRLQGLGIAMGSRTGVPGLHYLWEQAFIDGPDGAELSETFLHGVYARLTFAGRPLYALVHEAIYAQGVATSWAADRVLAENPDFAADAQPLLRTGETIRRHMFEHDPALRPVAQAADLLAERTDWPELYDLEVLAQNDVPVAAALYTGDMYVDADLSRHTAAAVRGARVWETNAYEHDGLREDPQVLDRLIRMARGEWLHESNLGVGTARQDRLRPAWGRRWGSRPRPDRSRSPRRSGCCGMVGQQRCQCRRGPDIDRTTHGPDRRAARSSHPDRGRGVGRRRLRCRSGQPAGADPNHSGGSADVAPSGACAGYR